MPYIRRFSLTVVVVRKRGKNEHFTHESICAEIGRYASRYGVAAATRHFSKKLDSHVSEATVRWE